MPLGEELDAFGDANDGMLWVRTAQAADDAAVQAAAEESPGARAPEVEPVLHSAIMDAEGNVVFDASMAEAALGIPEDFVAQYLHDGWWGICSDNLNDIYALICIQDGVFLGAIDAPPNLANYPTRAYIGCRRHARFLLIPCEEPRAGRFVYNRGNATRERGRGMTAPTKRHLSRGRRAPIRPVRPPAVARGQ